MAKSPSTPHVVKGLMYSMGSILTGGLGIGWIAKIHGGQFGRCVEPEDISAIAEDASAGSHGLIFLPFLLGSGSPRFDPDFSGAWIGLTSLSTQADVARSVMEGVAFISKKALTYSGSWESVFPESTWRRRSRK
ncbi:MAG: FGGY-family carbohydrate kinase [Bacillota bacterium]